MNDEQKKIRRELALVIGGLAALICFLMFMFASSFTR
jgi:hypothetical protein